jgi:predicted acetyltransferase
MRERGEVISGLYPASTRLYRGVGFELAGAWGAYTVPTRSLQMLRPEPGVATRTGTRDDIPAIKDSYRRVAQQRPGWLDRPEVWWERLLENWDEQYVYVVDGPDGAVDAYLRYTHRSRGAQWGYTIVVAELVADRPDLTIALWRLVGTSSTQAEEAALNGPPENPLLLLLPEQDIEQKVALRWMLRVIDAPGAVAARGYPTSVAMQADIEIDDRHCDWNVGRWRLSVGDGDGRLDRGGDGTFRMTVNAFSSLYAGYSSVRMLAEAGALTGGTPDARDALSAAFAGPTPWSVDFY